MASSQVASTVNSRATGRTDETKDPVTNLPECTICSTPTREACARCKSAWYCSDRCQQLDNALHQLLCNKYSEFITSNPRPASLKLESIEDGAGRAATFHLAIYLPKDSTQPELFWLRCEHKGKVDGKGNFPLTDTCVSKEQPFKPALKNLSIIDSASRNGKKIDVMTPQGPLPKYLVGNRCFSMLNDGYESQLVGELVIVHCENSRTLQGVESTRFADIQLADFRYALTLMCQTNNIYTPSSKNKYQQRNLAGWTRGIRVNCAAYLTAFFNGDLTKGYEEIYLRHDKFQIDGKWLYSRTKYSEPHPVFASKVISSVGEEMGMPLLVDTFKCPNPDTCPGVEAAAVIKTVLDVNSPNFALVPQTHKYIVVRQDKQDISLNQFNAFLAFSYEVTQRLKNSEPQCAHRRQAAVEKWLHSEIFEDYFAAYREQELEFGRKSWLHEPPPRRNIMGLLEQGGYGWREKST